MNAMNDDKLKITLRIADLKTPLALRVDYGADEKYWRDAADLFNKRWAFYKDKYKRRIDGFGIYDGDGGGRDGSIVL